VVGDLEMSRDGIIAGAAAVCFITGVALSHVIEPGVRVEKIMVTTNTPALRLFPATPEPHPIVLLAHGNGGSKETLFRYGEALAVAGFDCYSVDQPGYGESPQAWGESPQHWRGLDFQELERTLGEVDVFIGHSMGAARGSWSVREGFHPNFLIGVGFPCKLVEHGPPLLLLAGLFEEFTFNRPARLRAITNAQVVISPWSEHILEAYDPVLVRAAVKAACAAVGKSVPAAPTAWRWRFAGLVLGIAGALGLMFRLPELHPCLPRARRYIVPAVLLIALGLTLGTWVCVTPQWRRIPQQLVLLPVIWLALVGLSRLRLPRWSLAAVPGTLALGCMAFVSLLPFSPQFFKIGFLLATHMCTLLLSMLLLLPSALVGRIATRGGSRRDGDIAMAIFASYVIGQFMPLFY
jgi:hypothetical protein